jgi:hypothetical protein
MESTIANPIKVVRIWKAKLLDGGFVLYVPHYIVVG